jgi:Phosphotransferase enzyme family
MHGDVDNDLVGVAAALCSSAALPPPKLLSRLSGGKNNRVYRVVLSGGEVVVLKRYHHDPRDGRDRLAAEWEFLQYAAAHGVNEVPRSLARNSQAHVGLYSFSPGSKINTVTAEHVAQAVQFIRRLNGEPRHPMRLAPASEACFSLAAHLATVERRIAQLEAISAKTPMQQEVRAFVCDQLRPRWRAVRATAENEADRAGLSIHATLSPIEVCISPSDFGFHNALVDNDRATFIDFEYAGHDDPAKLVADFLCQPEIPLPREHYAFAIEGLIDCLGLDQRHKARAELLLDTYRIKWVCIMLNDFRAIDSARRAFAATDVSAEHCRLQLNKAEASLAAVGTH